MSNETDPARGFIFQVNPRRELTDLEVAQAVSKCIHPFAEQELGEGEVGKNRRPYKVDTSGSEYKWQLDDGNNWWLHLRAENEYELRGRYAPDEVVAGLVKWLNYYFE